jgi:hypothetical protein
MLQFITRIFPDWLLLILLGKAIGTILFFS